jgi:Tol biopolymer transport system component
MPRGLRSLALIVVLLLGAGACTQEPAPQLPQVDVGNAIESPSTSPSASAVISSEAPGRLAVLDDVGNIVTLDPDGSNAVVLAEQVPDELVVRQPTWSPDGERLAWVRFAVGDDRDGAIVTADPDGANPSETPTTVIPFYLSWDPTSSHIAYLGSASETDIALGVADAAGGEWSTPLDVGSPFFLSWNPSGEQLLVHVGLDRLDRLELDGTTSSVENRLGTFTAPVWTGNGKTFVYVSTTSAGERLVTQSVAADGAHELLRFDGTVVFVVSPDGRRVAYQVGHAPGEVEPLSVIDRKTGEIREVAAEITPSFFWSPDGSRLLYLFPDLVDGRVWFRWGVWDGESAFSTARFAPSDVFAREYLSFFEQQAQSMSLWAPDGSAFTYAGSSESGESGVWIQPAREGAEPVRVSDGVFATWSPA